MKILIYQSTSAFGDVQTNLKTIENTCKAGSLLNVDVVVFPELFLSGYNLGEKVSKLAECKDGTSVKTMQHIAKSSGVSIIAGYPEQDGPDIYNAAVAIDAQGNCVGHHRKVHLFGEREKQNFCPGNGFAVFDLAGYKCALSICYDIEFPEVSREIKRLGAEIVFVPTANMEPYFDVPTTLARSRALENGLAIVYANLCASEGDQTYTGLSAIIAPDGKDVARAGSHDTILIGDLNPSLTRNVSHPLSSQLQDLAALNRTPNIAK